MFIARLPLLAGPKVRTAIVIEGKLFDTVPLGLIPGVVFYDNEYETAIAEEAGSKKATEDSSSDESLADQPVKKRKSSSGSKSKAKQLKKPKAKQLKKPASKAKHLKKALKDSSSDEELAPILPCTQPNRTRRHQNYVNESSTDSESSAEDEVSK